MKDRNLILILAATVLIVAIFLAFGIKKESERRMPENFQTEVQRIEQQSTSDDPEDIEVDLMETELDNLDNELQDIEQELDESY